jgi:hypothetical protein
MRPRITIFLFVWAFLCLGFSDRSGEASWDELNERFSEARKHGTCEEVIEIGEKTLAEGETTFGPDNSKTMDTILDLASYLLGRFGVVDR